LPRLSVDLDLVFPDYSLPRAEALARISDRIRQATDRLTARGVETHILMASDIGEVKLLVRRGALEVKIEANFVMRGAIHSVHTVSLRGKAQDLLLADIELPLVSLEDLYDGNLVAAMDCQHPRDLFDIMQLFENEGITSAIRQAFVVYMASHNRPVHEVLFPARREIAQEYEGTFRCHCARKPVSD
jgi:predicted nucleotidyltransferase component of viral defense system